MTETINNTIKTSSIVQTMMKTQEMIDALNAPYTALYHLLKPIISLESISPLKSVLDNITPKNLQEYLNNVKEINKIISCLTIPDAILSLRRNFPYCVFYEHKDEKFFDEEIYPNLFDKKEGILKLNEKTLEPIFKDGELEIDGSNTKDFVSLNYLFSDITKGELCNFIRFLKKYPFMAMEKQGGTGWKIFDSLKEKAIEHCVMVNEGTILYRARKLNGNEAFFKDEEMLEPNTGIPNIGRFNPYGVALLYVSEDKETAAAELEYDKVQIAQLRVTRPLRCIDLKKSGGLVYDFCRKPLSSDNKEWNPSEYIVPNFLGQCGYYLKNECNIKLDGFRYESTKDNDKYCYVLFEVHPPNIKIENICCNYQ